jgi:hypothetical protein
MFSLLNTVVLTELIRHNAVPPTLVIAYGHAFSTVATDDEQMSRAPVLLVAEKGAREHKLDYSQLVAPRFSHSPRRRMSPTCAFFTSAIHWERGTSAI